MDLNNFATDVSLAEEGAWIQIDEETSIRVARYGNRRFKKVFARLTAPYKVQIQQGTLNEEMASSLLTRAIAEAILVDWKGMKKAGKDLPYSVEAAIKILSDETLSNFRDMVVNLSQDIQTFREQEVREDAEKLQSISGGN